EQHVGLEHGRIVERHVARPDRAEAEAVPASPDVRRIAVLAVAFGLEHGIDGTADIGHGDAWNGGLDAFVHGAHHELIFACKLLPRLADRHGAADLRELALIARRDLGEDDVARFELAAVRRLHRAIVRARAK